MYFLQMALRWFKNRSVVVDMNYEELDEYSRNENLLRESRNSSPERLSSSPEEFHKSFSPLSSER